MGRDINQDNLAIYDDGHQYCFSCHFYKPVSTLQNLRNKLDKSNRSTSSGSFLSDTDPSATHKIPDKALAWLKGYGITDEEIYQYNIWYDTKKELLVFPVYDGVKLVLTNSRYFGDNPKYPKYITQGPAQVYFKLFSRPESKVVVLVEDFVSAIKVGRYFNAIPLFGCSISIKLILSLAFLNPILRVWLDNDKNEEAIVQAQRARQYIENCGTIVTSMDPKEYDDVQIEDMVLESTSSNPASIFEWRSME